MDRWRKASGLAGAVLAALGMTLLVGATFGLVQYEGYRSEPLVEFLHVPAVYSRRTPQLSANVSGRLADGARYLAEYRLNGGPWRAVPLNHDRIIPPLFTLELPESKLRVGKNTIEMRASAAFHPGQHIERTFRYDPSPIRLPRTVRWKDADIEVQDGYWQRVRVDGEWRVRPVPGYEGYDRILLVAGAMPVPRRIETDVTFRYAVKPDRDMGFGVLSLWDGHPDDWTTLPRRGWSFALAWYWSKPVGAGNEISYKFGAGDPSWVNGYEATPFHPGIRYRIIVEDFPVNDAEGHHLRYEQRLKWWPAGQPEPTEWRDISDTPGSPLPVGEYGVALLAYNCQVEFGPVRILPLPSGSTKEAGP